MELEQLARTGRNFLQTILSAEVRAAQRRKLTRNGYWDFAQMELLSYTPMAHV